MWEVSWAHPKFGSMLASCSYDRKVLVHKEVQANSWSVVHVHEGHQSSVNAIAWAPHELGLVLAAASSDGSVSVASHKGAVRAPPPLARTHALPSAPQTTTRGRRQC